MNTDRKAGYAVRIGVSFLLLTQAAGGCLRPSVKQEQPNTPEPSDVPLPKDTSEPVVIYTATATNIPTVIPTEIPIATQQHTATPTPLAAELVHDELAMALDGEQLTLNRINVARVVVIGVPFRSELIYGVLIGPDGKTQAIFDNYDCVFKELRANNSLHQQNSPSGPLPMKVFDTDTFLTALTVKKAHDVTDKVGLFTVESVEINEQTISCPKQSTADKLTGAAKNAATKIEEMIINTLNQIQK